MTRLALTVLAAVAGLCAGCDNCEYHGGQMRGRDICVIHDDGSILTTEAEYVTVIGLMDDLLGVKKSAREDRCAVYTGVENATVYCGSISPTGECWGTYDGSIVFVRTAVDECFADTAFTHEWAHRMMDARGEDYWEHPDKWFGVDGVVELVKLEYRLLFCPEQFEEE